MTPEPILRTREGGTSGRRVDTCDECGERHETEFSVNLDARLCDGCYWKAAEQSKSGPISSSTPTDEPMEISTSPLSPPGNTSSLSSSSSLCNDVREADSKAKSEAEDLAWTDGLIHACRLGLHYPVEVPMPPLPEMRLLSLARCTRTSDGCLGCAWLRARTHPCPTRAAGSRTESGRATAASTAPVSTSNASGSCSASMTRSSRTSPRADRRTCTCPLASSRSSGGFGKLGPVPSNRP